MWIMLSNAFLSIVDKARNPTCLMVRARRAGEIEAVFPHARVSGRGGTDYRFRAEIDRRLVAEAIAREVMSVSYGNFKGSVDDCARHDAYMDVWAVMMRYQRGEYDPRARRVASLVPRLSPAYDPAGARTEELWDQVVRFGVQAPAEGPNAAARPRAARKARASRRGGENAS